MTAGNNSRSREQRLKLPVPAPWQPPVERALADLRERLAVPASAVAVTHVAENHWTEAGQSRSGLTIWLMARGRTYKYRSDDASGTVKPEGGS